MQFRFILIAAVVALRLAPAAAHDYELGSLHIAQPWVRATPKGASVGGGYMTITNKGTAADRLISASSPAAAKLEIHRMSIEGGVIKMRPLENGLEIKPMATVVLKPGGLHVMLMGLKQQLRKGDRVKSTLVFETAGKIAVEFTVEGMGGPARRPEHKMH
jgi:copper(I)-binding protein